MANNQNEADATAQRQIIINSIRAALNRENVWNAIMNIISNALCKELEQASTQPDVSVDGL